MKSKLLNLGLFPLSIFIFFSNGFSFADEKWGGKYSQPREQVAWQFPDKVKSFEYKTCGKEQRKYCIGFLVEEGKIDMVTCRSNSKGECPINPVDCADNDTSINLSLAKIASASTTVNGTEKENNADAAK